MASVAMSSLPLLDNMPHSRGNGNRRQLTEMEVKVGISHITFLFLQITENRSHNHYGFQTLLLLSAIEKGAAFCLLRCGVAGWCQLLCNYEVLHLKIEQLPVELKYSGTPTPI